jgi:hypothetical protein
VASSHRRRGTVISDRGALDPQRQRDELRQAAATYAQAARLLNADVRTALAAAEQALAADPP